MSDARTDAVAIAARLREVQARIDAACLRAGRPLGSVRLIAVSKGQPPEAIRAAYAQGQRDFGENYVQELQRKAIALSDLPELRLRFIGRLQRNKAKDVAKLGCAVDSIDSLALAQALSQRVVAVPAQALAGVVEDLDLTYDLVDGVNNPTEVVSLPYTDPTSGASYNSNQIRKVNIHMGVRSEWLSKPAQDYVRNHISTSVDVRSLASVDRYVSQ